MTLKWKRTNKTEASNGQKWSDLIGFSNGYKCACVGFWLVNCFNVILQHDWPIEQCLLHIRVFFGGKMKSPCFDLFIQLADKTTKKHLTKLFFNVMRKSLYSLANKPVNLIIYMRKTGWFAHKTRSPLAWPLFKGQALSTRLKGNVQGSFWRSGCHDHTRHLRRNFSASCSYLLVAW